LFKKSINNVDILALLLLFGTAFLGGLFVFLLKPELHKRLQILLSFSGAYLLAVCTLHLLPELYQSTTNFRMVGLFMLLGFLLQIVLELFSEGIEHGHVHVHKSPKSIFPIGILLSLCVHAFTEGLPLEAGLHDHAHHDHSSNGLLYGIVLHKLPVAIALTTMLLQSGLSKGKTLFWLFVFSAMAPLGLLFGHLFGAAITATFADFFHYSLALVVGMFLHVSTTILFESTEGHRFNLIKFISVLAGGLLAWFTL